MSCGCSLTAHFRLSRLHHTAVKVCKSWLSKTICEQADGKSKNKSTCDEGGETEKETADEEQAKKGRGKQSVRDSDEKAKKRKKRNKKQQLYFAYSRLTLCLPL